MTPPAVEVRRLLRRGARHELWLATWPRPDARVALKRSCRPTAEAVDELANEAAVLAAARHPHLVELRASVPDPLAVRGGAAPPALALEVADAGSLADVVARSGGLRPTQLAVVLQGAAAALGALHELGWLHGDVSPANVLYDRGRGPLVADLGTAARLGAPLPAPLAATPAFAAPELRPGVRADPRADVYALGATALWLLARAPEAPARAPLRPGPLIGVLLRAVQREPARRHPTMAHLLADLAASGVASDADSLRRHVSRRLARSSQGEGREVAPLVTARFGVAPSGRTTPGGEVVSSRSRWVARALRRRGA